MNATGITTREKTNLLGRTARFAGVLAMGGILATSAWGQQKPPIHGAEGAMTVVPTPGSAASQPALPAGHPGIPAAPAAGNPGLPAGHPAMPSGGADPALAGHGGAMTGPTVGAIRVNVSQGTQGAPALGKEKVAVQLFSRGVAIKSYEAALDDKGAFELHDLPLEVAFQPILTIKHGGGEQQYVGPAVSKMQPMVEMDMRVYETTGARPTWTIGLWDVDVDAVDVDGAAGLHFTELLGGFCPGDRAWTGDVVGGQQRTMTLRLPSESANIQLGPGLAEAGALVLDHTIVRGKTMLPGSTQYVYGYTVTAHEGKVTATFTAPADTSLFALYLPTNVKVESVTGLEVSKPSGTNADRQLLKSRSIKAGETVSAVISGIKPPVAATKPAALPQTSDLHLPVTTGPGK